MQPNAYLTQIRCQRCQAESFVTHIEHDRSDWIAACTHCGAENIVALARIKNVAVVSPALQVIGLRH